MFARIASLTWRRPKTVLAVTFLIAAAGAIYGRDVEHHLAAAGFTDSSSESAVATDKLRDGLGYDPDAGIALVVRAPGGGPLDLEDPEVRSEIHRIAEAIAGVEGVGFVNDPLEKGGAPPLIERDGESVVITGHLSTPDVEEDGGRAAEDAQAAIGESSLDIAMGGYARASTR